MTATLIRTVLVHHHARPGIGETVERMPLTDGQLTGWDCIRCGVTQTAGVPFALDGWVDGHGQVFTCAAGCR